MRLYQHHAAFRETVDSAVAGAWERKRGQPGYDDEQLADFTRLSRQYVLEEVAVGMVMAKDRVADIYPGSYLTTPPLAAPATPSLWLISPARVCDTRSDQEEKGNDAHHR